MRFLLAYVSMAHKRPWYELLYEYLQSCGFRLCPSLQVIWSSLSHTLFPNGVMMISIHNLPHRRGRRCISQPAIHTAAHLQCDSRPHTLFKDKSSREYSGIQVNASHQIIFLNTEWSGRGEGFGFIRDSTKSVDSTQPLRQTPTFSTLFTACNRLCGDYMIAMRQPFMICIPFLATIRIFRQLRVIRTSAGFLFDSHLIIVLCIINGNDLSNVSKTCIPADPYQRMYITANV